MSDVLFGVALSVFFCCVRNMVTLLPWLLYTDLSTSSYQCSLSDITRISLRMYSSTHSCCCIYCSFENNGHADIMSSIVSHVLYIVMLSVFIIFLLCNICFGTPAHVLLLIHLQFLLSDFLSISTRMCLFH